MKHPRQDAPHAHQIVCHGNEIFIPDLGTNSVIRQYPPKGGKDWQSTGGIWGFEAGDGPRHVAIHPKGTCQLLTKVTSGPIVDKVGTHLYTLCELSSTLVTHTLPPLPENFTPIPGQSGNSTPISRHSILPPADSENQSKMLASEIRLLPSLTPSGKHLLICTNRDSPNPEGDAIALFSVDDVGTVERTSQGWITGIGKHLRGMAVDREGRFVVVAGRDGGGLTIFERDFETGLTLQQVAKIDVEQAVAPLWMD